MRFILFVFILGLVHISEAQESKIPPYFHKIIDNSPTYLGLYIVEKDSLQYYYFTSPPLKGADRITTHNFYDKDGNVMRTSTSGGIAGKYTKFIYIETLWEKERAPIAKIWKDGQQFEVINTYSDIPNFKLKSRQKIKISGKSGLQLIDNNKVSKTYKIIPKKEVYYNAYTQKSFDPTHHIPANGILFYIDNNYFILFALDQEFFRIVLANEEGETTPESTWVYLKILNKKRSSIH